MKKNLTDEQALEIGRLLGYADSHAKKKARRFFSYLCGQVKNWDYDDTTHWGDMHKIVSIIDKLREYGILKNTNNENGEL